MVLPRDQLVEMRKTLLEKCEEVMYRMNWPFGKNNLKTDKIFKDLVQYHGSTENLNIKGLTHDDSIAPFKSSALGRKASHQPFRQPHLSIGTSAMTNPASGMSHQPKLRRNSGATNPMGLN